MLQMGAKLHCIYHWNVIVAGKTLQNQRSDITMKHGMRKCYEKASFCLFPLLLTTEAPAWWLSG